MAKLEELKTATMVEGLSPAGQAKIVNVEWFGDQAVKVTYEDASGTVQNRLVYRNEENTLEAFAEENGKCLRLTGHRELPVRIRNFCCD